MQFKKCVNYKLVQNSGILHRTLRCNIAELVGLFQNMMEIEELL